METLAKDIGVVVGGFIVALTLCLISKISKNMFKDWETKQKRDCVQFCIFIAVGLGFLGSIAGDFIQILCNITGLIVVVFIVLLATNIAANNK